MKSEDCGKFRKKLELTAKNWETFRKVMREADNEELEMMYSELVKERRTR